MKNEGTGTNKNKKQRHSDTSKPYSDNAYARKFTKTLRKSPRNNDEDAWLRQGFRRVQGDFTKRFWEDGWN